jgi:hypothetical protein
MDVSKCDWYSSLDITDSDPDSEADPDPEAETVMFVVTLVVTLITLVKSTAWIHILYFAVEEFQANCLFINLPGFFTI